MKHFLSVVIPVYNETAQLPASISEIQRCVSQLGIGYEVILVDDGSSDQSWSVIGKLSQTDSRIKGIKLSRNFGKEGAIAAGLDAIQGNLGLVMDADLQHPPEIIPAMYEKMMTERCNVVEALKRSRGRENLLNAFGAGFFYWVLRRFAQIDLRNASDYKLVDEAVLKAWAQLRERNIFFRGLIAWMGFSRSQLVFDVPERSSGSSGWNYWKLASYGLNNVVSLSSRPLRLITLAGMLFMLAGCIFGTYAILMKVFGSSLSGFTTVIVLQLITGSLILLGLGIVGEYIAKIYDEVKARPRYLVEASTSFDTPLEKLSGARSGAIKAPEGPSQSSLDGG